MGQIGLKDYDTQRDKRFAGTVKLPHVPRMRLKVCILGDAVHCEQAQNLGMPFRSVDDLKKLNKTGKFPTLVTHNDSLEAKVTDLKKQVKFQLKKVLCIGVAVANVEMSPDECRQNIVMSINFLVSLLKKNWNNVKTLHIKSTMGKCYRIHG